MAGEKLYPTLPELTSTPRVLLSSDEENIEEESGNEDEEFTALERNFDNSPPEYPAHGRHVESSKRPRDRDKYGWWNSLKDTAFVRSVTSGLISLSRQRKNARMADEARPRTSKPTILERNYPTLALLTAGVILAAAVVLVTSGNTPSSSFLDNYLLCPVRRGELRPCIPEDSQATVRELAHLSRRELYGLAELHHCGRVATRNITVGNLLKKLSQGKPGDTEVATIQNFEKVFQLILFNPHWGISVHNSKGDRITDWVLGVTHSDVLLVASKMVSLSCRLRKMLSAAWDVIWTLMTLGVLLLAIIVCVKLYVNKQRKQMESMFILVDKIMEVLRAHHRRSQKNKDLIPYLAIIHVRDMLIPPSERRSKEWLWSRAVQWIGTHESRVRVENRRISGEDFDVWHWIQANPPPTEEPPAVLPTNGGSWQGRAFEGHHSPAYTGAPSPCIRLKNMFETVKKLAEPQIKEYENAVLERCSAYGDVVHIYVDKRSNYGCIYFKMDSFKSAQSAFNQLHGIWFKKRLITAKFIPESKYYKWFPNASNATHPVRQRASAT